MSQTDSLGVSKIDSVTRTNLPALGMDLGGTKLSAARVVDGHVVGEARTVPTPEGPSNIISALVQLFKNFQEEYVIAAVGIATAGVVDCTTGEVIGSTGNLPGWAGTPLKRLVEEKIGLPVFVDNDANAAAYGDVVSMGLRDTTCVIGVTLGTGIGTGIIIHGRPFRGANWTAGECGHMRISLDNKRLCTCGLWDCWEAYGAGRGLVATCRDLLENVTPRQTKLAVDPHNLTTRMITSAAEDGDVIAKKAIDIWHSHVAAGMASLANALNPDAFVLSGGMSKVVDLEVLREYVADKTIPTAITNLRIEKSTLGDYAGIVGAAQCALDGIAAHSSSATKVDVT